MTIPFLNNEKSIYDQMAEIQKRINALDFEKKELDNKLSELKEKATEDMRAKGIKTHSTQEATFTLRDGYIRHDFDKAKFQKEYPDEFDKYLKDVEVKGSMSIKILG